MMLRVKRLVRKAEDFLAGSSSIEVFYVRLPRNELNGKYPAIPALQGGVKGCSIKETPCRKAPPFRAESFNVILFSYSLKSSKYLTIESKADISTQTSRDSSI
jgi:hypothetical protein